MPVVKFNMLQACFLGKMQITQPSTNTFGSIKRKAIRRKRSSTKHAEKVSLEELLKEYAYSKQTFYRDLYGHRDNIATAESETIKQAVKTGFFKKLVTVIKSIFKHK